MSTELSGAIQIDRLSCLPPELLSDIFDLADDPEHPLTEPLSRSLLPYFRQNLYRRIRISSPSSLSKLLETVRSHPSLGRLAFSLVSSDTYEEESDYGRMEDLLHHLPTLRSLSIDDLPFSPIYNKLPHLTPNLESIFLNCSDLSTSDVNILCRINGLKNVVVSSCTFTNHPDSRPAGTTLKPCGKVKKLSISLLDDSKNYDGAWTEDLARFIDKFFPHVTHLCLNAEQYPDYRKFFSALVNVLPVIESLVLQSGKQQDFYGISCQHLLPRFKNLKHLELGEGTVSSPLAEHLQQLPSLRTLRLAQLTHLDGLTLEDLLSVIDGSFQATSLRVLVVDSIPDDMKIGRRVDSTSSETDLIRIAEDGWRFDCEPGNWDLEDLEPLLEAGIRNGVEVKGSSFQASKVWRLANLEKANRLILRAYHSKSLDEYIAEKAAQEVNPRLSDLDVDQLDPGNLKLVKIDLPEEDWYQFTLE